jgi:hypothetical protein
MPPPTKVKMDLLKSFNLLTNYKYFKDLKITLNKVNHFMLWQLLMSPEDIRKFIERW